MCSDRSERIILMCDSIQRANFMFRLAESIGKVRCVLVTGEPLVKLNASLKNIKCIYLHKQYINNNDVFEMNGNAAAYQTYQKSIEYLNGEISLGQCISDSVSAYRQIEKYIRRHPIESVIIWNGQQLLGRVLSEIARVHQLKTLFLEISNLPNKLFVDPAGVNALSSIQADPSIISALEAVDPVMHRQWIERYKAEKSKPLPQASAKYSAYLESYVNRLIKKMTQGIGLRSLSLDEIKNKYKFKRASFPYDDCEQVGEYIFLPLQVTSDTQLKLHSQYNNIQAVEYAIDLARSEDCQLIVKPHPAERDLDEINKIIKLKEQYQFYLANHNTIELIENARRVVTINSTVGLEAMILGKEVTVLGKALYSQFSQADLAKYIHRYLVDGIDFFEHKKISQSKAMELLRYAG
jgi:capsular polysaccharide export protein